MTAATLMVQGTTSSAGKSLLVTALGRILQRRGWRVAPFKAQNMSNNSWIAAGGGEVGRAQAVQAAACRLDPTVDMNPVLLKPEADHGSQVVVLGQPQGRITASDYHRRKAELWPVVTAALDRLRAGYDLVLIEGAGSPAEINLRQSDIVNMAVALHARAPVLLIADIDRGGVFAHLHGTLALLDLEERDLVRGLVINQFRGDISLLRPGIGQLEALTGKPVAGVIPMLPGHAIPQEDSLAPTQRQPADPALLDIAVIRLPRISNATDFEPLARDPRLRLRYAASADELGRPDMVILPGTKSTVADLEALRQRGLDACLLALASQATPILGICGGYQMLGERIDDPDHVESAQASLPGLGLLPVLTTFAATKATRRVRASRLAIAFGTAQPIDAYEIHMGVTLAVSGSALPAAYRLADGRLDGAVASGGLVAGSYLHGLFDATATIDSLVDWLRARRGLAPATTTTTAGDATPTDIYDQLADAVEPHLDMALIEAVIAEQPRG